MPARKTSDDAESREPTPYVSREDAAGLTGETRTAPEPLPPADDQVAVTLPDGSVGVVDAAVADAMKAAAGKPTASVKNPPPAEASEA